MKSPLKIAISALLALLIPNAGCLKGKLKNVESWVCFYGAELPKDVSSFDLYIFDGRKHPDVAPLRKSGKIVVGYVSVGEITKDSRYYEDIRRLNIIADENPNWPGSFRVSFAAPSWHKFLLDTAIPEVLSQGFNGIFLDTIDTADYLENTKGLKGNVAGAVTLVEEIRKKYPEIVIVMNGGLTLTDKVGGSIDGLMVEDIYTLYDFETKSYNLATAEWTMERIQEPLKFLKNFKKPVLSLDYLDQNDTKQIETVTKTAKKAGFLPYIAEIDLQKVFFRP